MNGNEELGDLLIGIYKHLKAGVERDLKAQDIGMGQLQILMVFFNNMGTAFSQTEISRILGVDKGNISRSIAKLKTKGYLMNDDGDGRAYRLSAVGVALKSHIALVLKNTSLKLTKDVAQADIDQMVVTLKHLLRNVEELE
jgi:DNA-binding MarR family transcriptional regulator